MLTLFERSCSHTVERSTGSCRHLIFSTFNDYRSADRSLKLFLKGTIFNFLPRELARDCVSVQYFPSHRWPCTLFWHHLASVAHLLLLLHTIVIHDSSIVTRFLSGVPYFDPHPCNEIQKAHSTYGGHYTSRNSSSEHRCSLYLLYSEAACLVMTHFQSINHLQF